MFVDKVSVLVKAGDGGNGLVSFRREKFVDKGGPDGGDGGNGGDVIFQASTNQDTLVSFRYQRRLEAESGEAGSKRHRHGKSGKDLIILVPVGTYITDAEGELVADLAEANIQAVVAEGGKGGFGNAHFVSSTRQAPKLAEKGEAGEEHELILELKMIADVGLVGLPNAGKSTLLASISNAHPEIANYPFTTLRPNLGVVDIDKKSSLLVADIPGLIEGASKGKGLGDDFLRHVERTAVLLHLIDAYNDNIALAYKTIQKELGAYKVDLTKRPQIIAINKIDGLDTEIVQDQIKKLEKVLPKKTPVYPISAQSKNGVRELLYATQKIVDKERAKWQEEKLKDKIPVLRLPKVDSWKVIKTETGFTVSGRKIERFAARTDFSNYHAVQRLRDIMKKMGIMNELVRQGIEPGQKIMIEKNKLEY